MKLTSHEVSNPIAASSDGLLKIFKITHGIEDYVAYQFLNGAISKGKIVYQDETQDGESGLYTDSGIFYSFNDIMLL